MADQVSFRVEHADEIARALILIGVTAVDPRRSMQLVAREGVRLAASYSPVLTDRLRSSWTPLATRGRALVRSDLIYAGVIDHGWPGHNIAPAGISKKTDAALEREAEQAIGDDIDRTIREQGLSR